MNYEKQMLDFAMSMVFSLLNASYFWTWFCFPTIDPYVVIKWIVIACAVVFAYSIGVFFLEFSP